jgi:hypothetical protein
MIYRCVYNGGWIRSCYGKDAYELVKMNPISCSGVSLGSRDAILVYVSTRFIHTYTIYIDHLSPILSYVLNCIVCHVMSCRRLSCLLK